MQEISSETPEARHQQHLEGKPEVFEHELGRLSLWGRTVEVTKRVAIGVYQDGFIHAGNLAYLSLLTLFPFFIVTAALASVFGRDADTILALESFLRTMPASVQTLLRQPISDVLNARTGWLLWLGAAIGLWTVGSFIETIRDILRRAYGTPYSNPFWHYRLSSMGIIIGAVVLMMTAFSAQVILTAAEQFVYRLVPFADDVLGWIRLTRLIPLFVLWGALYLLLWSLTPSRYRFTSHPKWPGALFISLWWVGSLAMLPWVISLFGGYDLTYGSLAGVIVALFFFWIIGFGLVIGAHLNAALAEPPSAGLKLPPQVVEEAQ